jgi:hypothetical protein
MNFLILCDAVRKYVYIMLMPGYAEKPKENLSFFFLEFFCQYQLLLYYPNNTSCAHSHIIYSGFLSLSIYSYGFATSHNIIRSAFNAYRNYPRHIQAQNQTMYVY